MLNVSNNRLLNSGEVSAGAEFGKNILITLIG